MFLKTLDLFILKFYHLMYCLFSAELSFRNVLSADINKGRIFLCASSRLDAVNQITKFIASNERDSLSNQTSKFVDFRFHDIRNHGVNEPVLIYKPKQ